MKLEENVTHKMLKILRFFRREQRSADVSGESNEAGKGLTLFQHLAFNKSFSVCLYFTFLLLTGKHLFILKILFSWLIYRFTRDNTLVSYRALFHYQPATIFARSENLANLTLHLKFVENRKQD